MNRRALARPGVLAGVAALALLVLAKLALGQTAEPPPTLPTPPSPTTPKLDSGDTAWMLVSTTLVLLMTIPGLALFYGGLVRAKNVLSTLMHSFFCAALISVLWVVAGYSIAFGPSGGLWLGGLDHLGLSGVAGTAHPLAPTIPHYLFVAYQLTFAVITPALISGAFAERMRFSAFALLIGLWSLLVYAPLAHWVWGGGWIGVHIGALDFAGGTVVHISSGVSALVCALHLGKRHGYGTEVMPPHNLPFTTIGAGLLWVGWFGFNAGSALASNELASMALINTNTAAATAALGWMAVETLRTKKPTLLGLASGAVAGLVVITPAAGFVTPMAALVMGLLGGAVCYFAVALKPRLGYDDALDVVGVHFVGGTLGALLTGVFATAQANPAIAALTAGGNAEAPTTLFGSLTGGLMDGQPALIMAQIIAVAATIAYAGAVTWILLKVIGVFFPARAGIADEVLGMDLSQHSERGYVIGGGEAVAAAAVVLAEPRSASTPPASPQRFKIVLDHVDQARIEERWRQLCRQVSIDERQAPSAFGAVYPNLVTVRGNTFRFRAAPGQSPEELRTGIEALFADLGARARIEE